MIVRRIARDSENVDRVHSAENQGDLRLRHVRHPRHEADVAHRAVTADGDVEERRSDSAGENAALDRAAARVWYVENQLVDQRLSGETGGREDELLVRVFLAVDAGVDGGPPVIEAKRRMESHRERAQDVRALVREEADPETEGKFGPIAVGLTGSCRERRRLLRRQSGRQRCRGDDGCQCSNCASLMQTYLGLRVLHAGRCIDG